MGDYLQPFFDHVTNSHITVVLNYIFCLRNMYNDTILLCFAITISASRDPRIQLSHLATPLGRTAHQHRPVSSSHDPSSTHAAKLLDEIQTGVQTTDTDPLADLVAGIDGALVGVSYAGVLVVSRDAHLGAKVVCADEQRVNALNSGNLVDSFQSLESLDHGNNERAIVTDGVGHLGGVRTELEVRQAIR